MKETTGERRASSRIEYWREQVAQHERSGLSVKQFCEAQRIPEQSFYVWRKRLQEQPPMRFALVEPKAGERQPAGEGRAVRYVLKNWKALTRYAEDGNLEIDNSATERSIRGVAVGRTNWMFFGSDAGGSTAAVLRSFVASCQRAKVDPFAWFQDVLSRIGAHPINRITELLPHNWAQA
jgi:transposase